MFTFNGTKVTYIERIQRKERERYFTLCIQDNIGFKNNIYTVL